MFVVWGTKSRQEEGGVIGDWCDVCHAPNFHRLIHFYKVSHIYYIPLGRGTYVGTNRQCAQCGTTNSCNMNAYPRAMTHQEAYGRSIEEVLAATNPFLLEQIQKQRSLEYQIAQRMAQPALPSFDVATSSPPSGQADHRMMTALQTLRTLDARDRDVIGFTDRLQRWDYLSPSEREVLLHEIDAFAIDDHKVNAAIHFMRMLPTPTPGALTCLGCFGWFAIFVVGLAAVPFLQSWLWGSLYFIGSVVLWVFASGKATDRAVRGWVRKVLLPRSQQHNVDLRYFVGLLSGMKGNTGGYEEKIVDMVRNVDAIADELHKQGYLKMEDPPAIPPSPPPPSTP